MGKTHLFISNFEAKDTRRLFLKILLFVPVLLFVAAINIYIDPMGLYNKPAHKYRQREYQAAQRLAEGRNVELPGENIDDRLIEKYLLEDITVAPDVAILGSSHSMWLGDNIFSGRKVMNNSVLDAVLADYLGIFEGYAKKGLYPKRVVCVLDPQLTAYPVISARWASIKDDTYGMLERLGVHPQKIKMPAVPQTWFNILSFSYFQKAVDAYHLDKGSGDYVMLKDGRRSLEFFFKKMEKNRRKIILELDQGAYARGLNQKKPDQELGDVLEDFLRYLTGHHIQVTLCMLPLHPQLYKSFLDLRQRPGSVDITGFERYYRGLAQRLNLDIVGSYDPAACDLDSKDFYDLDHIRNEVIEKILKQKGTQCSMPGL